MKKWIKRLIVMLFSLIVSFHLGMIVWGVTPKLYINMPIHKYYKAENYYDIDSYGGFLKYYFYDDITDIENQEYVLVKDDVEKVKNTIRTSLDLNKNIDVNFDYDVVTSDDYYYLIKNIENDVLLHYYDKNEKILYITSYYQ